MLWQAVANGYVLRGARYGAHLILGENPCFRFTLDGVRFGEFPVAGCFDRPGEKERLSKIVLEHIDREGPVLQVVFTAESTLWEERTFHWQFEERLAEHWQTVSGHGKLGRCHFCSSGVPGEYDNGDSFGGATNARIDAEFFLNPAVNLGNVEEFRNTQPGVCGLSGEFPIRDQLALEYAHGLFSPSPTCLVFHDAGSALGIGLGTEPGGYRFNAFEYSGSRKQGAAFFIQYFGYTQVDGDFTSPRISFTFANSPMDALQAHVDWLDCRGFSTRFGNAETPNWHFAPVFCGWGEQVVEAWRTRSSDFEANATATQENYERWLQDAEAKGIPFSTVVIDDKWQKHYGTFEVDTEKWPDMPGFIARQHQKGRHVLLWTASYHWEGLPEDLVVHGKNGQKLFANVADPRYEALIREQITHLVGEVGVDGFKEDWIGGSAREADLPGYGALHGLEMLRRFQFILWDAAHRVKPDALVETQTPHPLFRESSDVLRLNDLWFATRHVPETMRHRARIARICGWRALDCDNAACTTPEEWFRYMLAQVRLGTPALYLVSMTESYHEEIPAAMWDYVAALWQEYTAEQIG